MNIKNLKLEFTEVPIAISFHEKKEYRSMKDLKDRCYVYGLINEGEIIYIGASVSIFERLLQHVSKNRYLVKKEFESYFLIEFKTRNSAFREEKHMIFNIKPKYNVMHKHVIEAPWSFIDYNQ